MVRPTGETFSIPGVGGIISTVKDGEEYLLIQDRYKPDAPAEYHLIEIPAGKVRSYESVFECLRREIREETGCEVASIEGEAEAQLVETETYKVLTYTPFSCAQNLKGYYPIMVEVFRCTLKDEENLLEKSSESRNMRWISKTELKALLKNPSHFYPMHIKALEKFCSD